MLTLGHWSGWGVNDFGHSGEVNSHHIGKYCEGACLPAVISSAYSSLFFSLSPRLSGGARGRRRVHIRKTEDTQPHEFFLDKTSTKDTVVFLFSLEGFIVFRNWVIAISVAYFWAAISVNICSCWKASWCSETGHTSVSCASQRWPIFN